MLSETFKIKSIDEIREIGTRFIFCHDNTSIKITPDIVPEYISLIIKELNFQTRYLDTLKKQDDEISVKISKMHYPKDSEYIGANILQKIDFEYERLDYERECAIHGYIISLIHEVTYKVVKYRTWLRKLTTTDCEGGYDYRS